MRAIAVIPARMGASRFPGKPLAPLGGRPMIEHVYRGTVACPYLDEVLVATCDRVIHDAVVGFGGQVALTAASHVRASDRVAEVSARDPAEIVVMVQGDEPMVEPEMVSAAIDGLVRTPDVGCVNLMAPIDGERDARDPNTIKVVTSATGRALFLSRAMVPSRFAPGTLHKQVCVIAFRRAALARFAALSPGPLERLESIDMLRFLEHDLPVQMIPTIARTQAVDTREDLARVSRLMGFA
ncbi:3-deoxy-manno-octulosonate cytidylyltransferase [Luteitalea sp.]|uniref:3-deoxy-manno-octulosonate cytidylyltransferase n=1 Tax=Luteitalea sp. TaxID=2004800 RepID=UPI0025C06F91|nr:3-deoxy-manno-octulosonate cytidylyltransferase [Luteitalea sp.]